MLHFVTKSMLKQKRLITYLTLCVASIASQGHE